MPVVEPSERRALLARSLHCYDLDGFPPGTHVGLPSSTITVVIPLDPPLDVSGPGTARRTMTSCVAGLHDVPTLIHHDGVQRGLQFSVAPLALDRLFGVPTSALANRCVEFADLFGERTARRLLDPVASAPSWPDRVALLEKELLRRLGREPARPAPRAEVVRAWRLLASSAGAVRIGDVAAEVGWSVRHLDHQFTRTIGTTPKTTAGIMRFERSVRMIRAGHDLAGVAARCRYSDQAHMTRVWNRLAGTTPARWARDDRLANVQYRRQRPVR